MTVIICLPVPFAPINSLKDAGRGRNAMFETWETQKRIEDAKRLTARVVDHLQYLLDIHENNAVALQNKYAPAITRNSGNNRPRRRARV
jgi:hypothetical protein